MKPVRPFLSLVVCAALVGGLVPPGAARAAGTALGAPVGEAGAGAQAAVGAASMFASPGLPNASVIALAPLNGASTLSAPTSVAPSITAPASVPALSAAAADPSAASPAAAAVPLAAAPSDEATAVPIEHAAASETTRTWLSRAAALFPRRTAPQQSPAPVAEAKAQSDRLFDGASAESAAEQTLVAAPQGRLARLKSGLRRFAARRVAAYQAKRAVGHDDFGGPKFDGPKTLGAKVAYGLKWGLNLIGLSAISNLTITAVSSRFDWPVLLSPSMLERLGRVELLTKFGPDSINAALIHAPLPFLGIAVPLSTASEEFSYRFLSFGLTFGLLAAAKPVAVLLGKLLDNVPDAAGFRSTLQRAVLTAGRAATYFAFPLAAFYSSFRFAAAHFAHWGIDPAVFALNLVAGWVLARVAYRTRGLTAPFVAHLFFNFAMLGSAVLGVTFGLPQAASVYGAIATIVGVAALWYNWRTARKLRALSRRTLGGATSLLVAGLISTALLGTTGRDTPHAAIAAANAVSFSRAQTTSPETSIDAEPSVAAQAALPKTAEDAAAPFKTDADMVASVKPSVVEIVVKVPRGTAIGSGVIVSPNGLLVTNGHVVGDEKVGSVVRVKLSNDQVVGGKIVAVNHDRDLAFIQLPNLKGGAAWPYSTFAKTVPREGDPLLAMGHPLGLPFTVTKGILSGLGERSNMFVQYVQTDAPINHGNSGGPLYNTRGEIVGINTMIAGKDGSIGIGFSITAEDVVLALQQYAATGDIATAALGIIVDLSSPARPDAGVAVESVRPGSAAAKAGLRPGDLIVGVSDKLIGDGGSEAVNDLASVLAQTKPGAPLKLAVLRESSDKPLVLTLKVDARVSSPKSRGS
jgi:S1-C subfamily serine protease